MTRPRRCIALLLLFAGIILATAQVPTIGAPTLELTTRTRSKIAAEALKKTWELKQRGDALPPGCESVSVWSQRYIDAVRIERKDDDGAVFLLKEHGKFMEQYIDFMNKQRNAGKVSELELLDAEFGFFTAAHAVQDAMMKK